MSPEVIIFANSKVNSDNSSTKKEGSVPGKKKKIQSHCHSSATKKIKKQTRKSVRLGIKQLDLDLSPEKLISKTRDEKRSFYNKKQEAKQKAKTEQTNLKESLSNKSICA